MSWRRLAVLLDHLPIESEYKTAVRNATDLSMLPPPTPGVFGPWPESHSLLARIGDLMETWMWANSNPEKRPAQPPRPYPRPGVGLGNVRAISEEALAFLEYKRQHQGADPPTDWIPVLA